MYPWYSMEIPADSRLPLDDRIAIQHLYGPNQNGLHKEGKIKQNYNSKDSILEENHWGTEDSLG